MVDLGFKMVKILNSDRWDPTHGAKASHHDALVRGWAKDEAETPFRPMELALPSE